MRALGSATVAVVGLGTALTIAGCAPASPAAVAAVGLDADGYLGVVTVCDEVQTLTYVQFHEVDGGAPAVAWIGRTVEPITFYRVGADPPDNWVLDVDGGLVSDVEYVLEATGTDLEVLGPQFTLEDLGSLQVDEVIGPDGVVSTVDEFLDGACRS